MEIINADDIPCPQGLPRFDIDPGVDVDFGSLVTPTRDHILSPGWILQREYLPLYDRADWTETEAALENELAAFKAASHAATEEEFEDLVREYEFEWPVEVGVQAATLALNAAGCVTATCCRGHEWKPDHVPQVLFLADQERARIAAELAPKAGCRLESSWDVGLAVIAPTARDLVVFGSSILASRARFDSLASIPRLHGDALEDFERQAGVEY